MPDVRMRSVRLQHVVTCIVIHKVHHLLVIIIITVRLIYAMHSVKMSSFFERVGQVLGMTGREICAICHLKLCGQKEITLNTLTILINHYNVTFVI